MHLSLLYSNFGCVKTPKIEENHVIPTMKVAIALSDNSNNDKKMIILIAINDNNDNTHAI